MVDAAGFAVDAPVKVDPGVFAEVEGVLGGA